MTLPVSPIPALSADQWREDLQIFARELAQRHYNPWHLTSRNVFEHAVVTLDAQIPTLKPYEVVVGIQRLAALI
jgi:hypothetical protein